MTIFPLFNRLERYFNSQKKYAHKAGEVFIVGAGPGDAGLLTIKALHILQRANVIFYDYLVSDEILELANKNAQMISVGKRAGNHSVPQNEINQLLVDYARQGLKVCRLKGGDPYIFGRGGEEAQALVDNAIPFQVVPGITAASGCAAYAGIPLTHRDYAQSVQVITGHTKKDGKAPDWAGLAKPNQTLVVYMGKMNAAELSEQLIAHGRPTDLPVAVVESGSTQNQRVVTGELHGLAQLIDTHQIGSPALIIIGEVVKLSEQLNWFNPTTASIQQHEVVG